MLYRRYLAALLGVVVMPLCGLAVAGPGTSALSDQALIEEAKLRAGNGLPESDALPFPTFDYRNLKVVRSGQRSPVVCGEVKERNSDIWTLFGFNVGKDEINLEPHPALNDEVASWFSTQCRAAVRHVRLGRRGTPAERRTCEVSAQLAEAQLERARFMVFQSVDCGAP